MSGVVKWSLWLGFSIAWFALDIATGRIGWAVAWCGLAISYAVFLGIEIESRATRRTRSDQWALR